MNRLSTLLFGTTRFEAREEHLEFQYKFLCIVIVSAALLTALLIGGSHSAVNPIAAGHVRSMTVFTSASVALWLLLRGRKSWYLKVAWAYECLCMLEYVSALYYVSEDEFRVVWFLTNIPGVYLLLGRSAGVLVTLVTAIGLAMGNPYLASPYSPNAMATLLASVLYLGLFFYVYADRSRSYFVRMRESNERLYHLAMHDALTGVLNARAYYQTCDPLISLARRTEGIYAVLFVDLDHFKAVNDTYGHAAGDLVLKSAALCIGQNIRASDLLGRVGGEEFSVFLPDTNLSDARRVAEKIRAAMEQMVIEIAPGTMLKITASIGVAGKQHHDQTLKEIQQHADAAMYDAKQGGRNRVSCFEQPTPQ